MFKLFQFFGVAQKQLGVLFILLIIPGMAQADLGFDDHFFDYSFSSSFGRKSSRQVISLDLNPQEVLNSSLRMAAREGRFQDLKVFLQKGADVNSRADSGETALMYSSKNCTYKLAEHLVQKGADINARDSAGRTALMHAAAGSCISVVELLLKSPRIDIEIKDRSKRTAYDYAVENSLLEVDGPSQKIIQSIFEKRKKRFIQQFVARSGGNNP